MVASAAHPRGPMLQVALEWKRKRKTGLPALRGSRLIEGTTSHCPQRVAPVRVMKVIGLPRRPRCAATQHALSPAVVVQTLRLMIVS
jgi:hypothetical protein